MSRFGSPGPSAWGFHRVAPVGFFGVDGVDREDLAGGEVDDGDGGVVGDQDAVFAAVGGADAEVVHAGGAAEADFSVGVDVVVTDPVVAGVGTCSGGDRFG